MQPTIIHENLPPHAHLVITSDIHGRLDLFDALLRKVGFGDGDILIVVGDMIDKGPDSLGVLRRLMELSRTHRVICLAGNVDSRVVRSVDNTESTADAEGLLWYLHAISGLSIVSQAAAECSLPIDSAEELLRALPVIREHLAEELDYLRSFPTVVETENFIFVHGGLPTDKREEFCNFDADAFMKYDAFAERTPFAFDKYVVVGHWPVVLYCERTPCSMPIVDREKRIISIDGGCSIKADGQLNAMIVRGGSPGDIDFDFVDGFPKFRAIDAQDGAASTIHIRWTEREVEVLSQGDGFAEIHHPASGRNLRVPEGFLYNDGKCIRDYTDLRHEVEAGDVLSVVKEYGGKYLVKKDGITGWYSGRVDASGGQDSVLHHRSGGRETD